MKKSLIEEPTIELLELFDKISKDAQKEKLAGIPINRIHYWWTRKPLIISRVITLASTLNNIDDVRNLLGLRKDKRAYLQIPDVGVYKKKLGRDPSEIKVLDPFGGGGNLIFEIKQLGLDCTISDYNPVAYLIQRATLDFPTKCGIKLADNFEKYAKQAIELTEKEVGQFFKPAHLVYIWSWCIRCTYCNQRFPLVNHMWIENSSKKKIGIRFHVTDDGDFTTELVQNLPAEEGSKYTQKGGKAICISCKNALDYKTITEDITKNKDREMLVIQIEKTTKRDYVLATKQDKKLYYDALQYLQLKRHEFEKEHLIPDEDILACDRRENRLWHYGITQWYQYFSERQLLVLITLLQNIKKVFSKNSSLSSEVLLYCTLMMSKFMNYSSLGIPWDKTTGTSKQTLTLRRPSMVFNHSEVNPFEKVAGSLVNHVSSIKKGIEFAAKNTFPVKIELNSVTKHADNKYDLIITDPPYADDVQYGELSEFFYVWIYRCLKDYFPELPKHIPLEEDFCESWGRFGNKKRAEEFFDKGLKKSFVSMNQKLKDDGLLVVFFAHSSPAAWNQLLASIRDGKFKVVSSFALHTESDSNVISKNKTAFKSSIIVVCRKLTEQKTAYFEDIIPQTEDNIKEMIDKIPAEKLLTIPITDLLIMVYGKVLETCTQFTELKSYEKDFKPNFETLIKGSQDFIMRELVAKLTGRNMNLIGSEMAFYLLVRIFYRGKMAADDAIKITRAIMVDLNKLEKEGMITNVGGVTNLTPLQETNLELKPEELDNANLYQQLCYLATICQTKGASKVSAILSQSAGNIKADELKKIVPLLIKSYRLQINKNQKLDDSEQEELKILETISDTWGGTKIEGTLDGFVEK